jgi:serine O-acetyltransferase
MPVTNWPGLDTAGIAASLIRTNEHNISGDTISGFGMKAKVAALIDDIRSAMYPNIYDTNTLDETQLELASTGKLDKAAVLLDCMITEVLVNKCEQKLKNPSECDECRETARKLTIKFMNGLTEIAKILNTDIEAAYNGDPAAISFEEILLSYPGFEAVSIYRLAHALYELNKPLLPRIMTEQAPQQDGIDIHPGATIGRHFFIDHGTGVVIGETCVIGDHVKIYQGVTLGAKSFELDANGNPVKGVKRHPNIGDGVIIYAGATILGGKTAIGKNSVVGETYGSRIGEGLPVYNTAPGTVIK